MSKKSTSELSAIEQIVNSAAEPLSRSEIAKSILFTVSEKTLQRRLKQLVDEGRISTTGSKRGFKYKPHASTPVVLKYEDDGASEQSIHIPISSDSSKKLKLLEQPSFTRAKVGYDKSLLENYEPNVTRYVPDGLSVKLQKMGTRFNEKIAAGTYAKDIMQRLLVDLSFNSSRLEGNTYSILDTQRLLEMGEVADGKFDEETIMILNHKEAIRFVIENAEELTVTPLVIRNLHQILSQDLLKDSGACGRIRQKEVMISKTAYTPLNAPQQLEELFTLLLMKAERIKDPFEQSFFLLMHISYLQAFEDVNKRTARMSCNLPFVQLNLCPLSFIDVPQDNYVSTLLYFYETGDYTPALEVFAWAYERSCKQYNVVEKSIGEIDSYRIRYRSERKEIMGHIVREMITGEGIRTALTDYCSARGIDNPDKFIAITLSELDRLHAGAIMPLRVTEKTFAAWQGKYLAEK